ncbi:MAG TPA: ROK family protein [Pirellulales bacterium]|nr:ROK family protein [Pirellulales bacterium]
MSYLIGVDVGGTTTTLAIANERGEVLSISGQFPTRSEQGPQQVTRSIVEQAVAAVHLLGGSIDDVVAVGLATPGPATVDGVLLKSPNLDPTKWDKFPIRAELEKAFQSCRPGLGVRYLGDGQAAALGEFAIRSRSMTWKQAAANIPADRPLSSLFMVIVGTGLGGGAVQQGQVVRGREGRAGHAGHVSLPPHAFRYEHDRQLLVGNSYCTAESAVSLSALTHQLGYRLSLDRWRNHPLQSAGGSTRDKAKLLRGLADCGDELALELFDDQAQALGITLLNVNYLGDYDLLVIGGGVCDLSPAMRERYRWRVIDSYWRHALEGFQDVVDIEFSVCGDDAPVIGAIRWVASGPARNHADGSPKLAAGNGWSP